MHLPLQRRWRLLITPPAPGAWNMAVDEAILEHHAGGVVPPTLRLYAWQPPALSLGYFQSLAEVDLEACRQAGVQVVRRPTGGRAILHDREVTYSVVISEQWLPGDVLQTYLVLSRGLLAAVRGLGAQADLADAAPGGAGGPTAACFDTPSRYELEVEGRKLVGSAQTRREGVILQHGAIPLDLQAERLFRMLKVSVAKRQLLAKALEARATDLNRCLGRQVAAGEVQDAVARGFGEALGLQLHLEALTDSELRRAEALVASKYGHPSWTNRR
ncbi:MAG: lipoate--protein ligase family protein [Actinobacteria bacterium]|nr:lipoate--protein ligase family protein [Actinomycetota bacterium]